MPEHQPPCPEFGTRLEDFAELHELMCGLGALNYALLADNMRDSSSTVQSPAEDESFIVLNAPEPQKMARSVLEIIHTNTLYAAGLALGPVRHLRQGQGEAVHISINDGNAFCHLMEKASALDYPHDFDIYIGQIAMQTMTEVYCGIDDQAYDIFAATVEPYSSEIAVRLSRIPAIDPICVEGWLTVAAHARTRTLKEWVKADQACLLEDVDTQRDIEEGPAVWHQTHSPVEFMNRWNETVKLFNQLSLNPEAVHFYQELLGKVRAAFDFAHQDFLSQSNHPAQQAYYNTFQSVAAMLTTLSKPR